VASLREHLKKSCPQGQQRILSFQGLLKRDEILLLRLQNDISILHNAQQSGRIKKINESQTVWRNWLSRLNPNIQPLIDQIIQRGNTNDS
jgi:hypothetical protein